MNHSFAHRFIAWVVLIAFSASITGCQTHGGYSHRDMVGIPMPGNEAANLSIRIRLPGSISAESPLATIRAAGGSSGPTVTLSVSFVQFGNTTAPFSTLKKMAPVDASGTATLEFTGLPTGTILGQLHIDSGRIGSYTEFQGAIDLVDGPNTLWLAPTGSLLEEDVLATVLSHIVTNTELFSRADRRLLKNILQVYRDTSPESETVINDIIAFFTSQPALVAEITNPLVPYEIVSLRLINLVPQVATYSGTLAESPVVLSIQGSKAFFLVPTLPEGMHTLAVTIDGTDFQVTLPIGANAGSPPIGTAEDYFASMTVVVNSGLLAIDPSEEPNTNLSEDLMTLRGEVEKLQTAFAALPEADKLEVTRIIAANRAAMDSAISPTLLANTLLQHRLQASVVDDLRNLADKIMELEEMSQGLFSSTVIFASGVGLAVWSSAVLAKNPGWWPAELCLVIGVVMTGIGAYRLWTRADKIIAFFDKGTLLLSQEISGSLRGSRKEFPSVAASSILGSPAGQLSFESLKPKVFSLTGNFSSLSSKQKGSPFPLVAKIVHYRDMFSLSYALLKSIAPFEMKSEMVPTSMMTSPIVATLQIPGNYLSFVPNSISNSEVELFECKPMGNSLQLTFSTTASTEQLFTFALNLAVPGISSDQQIFSATVAPFVLLSPPTNVKATGGTNKVSVTWDAVEGATGYRMYFQDSAGVTLATANSNYDGWPEQINTVTDLSNGKTYYFAVSALGLDGSESGLSVEVSATPIGAPANFSPFLDEASPDGASINCSWDPVEGATGYRVWLSESYTGTSHQAETAGTSYSFGGLIYGVKYDASVVALGPDNAESEPSSIWYPVATGILPPTILSVSASPHEATISWSAVKDADYYWVFATGYSTFNAFEPMTKETTFTFTGLDATYHIGGYVEVRGRDGSRNSVNFEAYNY